MPPLLDRPQRTPLCRTTPRGARACVRTGREEGARPQAADSARGRARCLPIGRRGRAGWSLKSTDPITGLPETDCGFGYYKEVLGNADCSGLPLGWCRDTLFPTSSGPQPVRLAPVAIDCGTPLPWRNTFCSAPLPGTDIAGLATEHDFMQFFWSIYSKGARVDIGDIFKVVLSACNGEACLSTDTTDPNNPCFKCAQGITNDLPLFWAAGPTVGGRGGGGLQGGAEEYFTAVLGEGSAEFANFEASGETHGITPESLPPPPSP